MSRKKGTRRPRIEKKSSDPLPAGRRTSGGSREEFIFTDYTDTFFRDGKVKTGSGTSNVLIVAPNMSPDTDDKKIGLLACLLAETLGAYAVVNCGCYRRPVGGDPTPEELQLSNTFKPSKKYTKIMQLRQGLWDETGGIPVNLDLFRSASTAADEYVRAIWFAAAARIGSRAVPLAFFLCGIDDAKADEFGLDVAVGAGYRLENKEQVCERDSGSAGGAFVEELIGRLSLLRDGISVRDGVEGYALDGDDVAARLRYEWAYERNRPSGDALRAEDVYCVLLAVRYTGFRDSPENLRRTVTELAGAISGLSLFKSWQEKEMAKKATKKPKKSKTEKATPSAPIEATAADEQPSTVEGNTMTKQPAESAQAGVSLISQEKFQEKIQSLRDQATITNDKDVNVSFEGEAKEVFIAAFEKAYPVIERALGSINELGTFLLGVRKELKPHKLYYAWLEHAGIPERTAANYVQVCERYSDKLPKFAHLGIKKLLAASVLEHCVDYVEKNEQTIEDQSADELKEAVKALRSTKKSTKAGRGRKPTYLEVGKCRIRPSMDGTRLVIEGITKKKQDELIEAIKDLLS